MSLLNISWLAGGLWIAPSLTFIGAIIFGLKALKQASKGYAAFSLILFAATIFILLMMYADR